MKGSSPGRVARTVNGARRMWPVVLMAWERWQSLTPEQQERYKRQAREYMQRGKDAAAARRRRP